MSIYEIYYENQCGNIVFCGILQSEMEAINEIRLLGSEFPENSYWYEVVFAD